MKYLDFNKGWKYKNFNEKNYQPINLPHDAMLYEGRSEHSLGGSNISYFKGGIYEYIKIFKIDEDLRDKVIYLEFESVYRDSQVFINGELVGSRPYGYTNFYVKIDENIIFDQENELKVIVNNNQQPNSRWYTGSGIYRPVKLIIGEKEHIKLNGIKIQTIDIRTKKINIEVLTNQKGLLDFEVLDGTKSLYKDSKETNGKLNLELQINDLEPWSIDHPKLYTLITVFGKDIEKTKFGFRSIDWDEAQGFRINGKREILKGACIHHDNGLLGAITHPDAEKRKVKLLKELGYNAIRSAHNPCSKDLLDACDELGMYVLDEYVDMWYIHKTKYDYASHLFNWWKEDLSDMVNKDYNHPSVIMYSTGNEVSETAQEIGINFTAEMTNYLHKLDQTRPVTCGINIFFNYLSSLGLGVYSDKKANQTVKSKKKKAVGSEFYNQLAGLMGDKFMKWGASLRGSDKKTKDAFTNMDIAGYNYGILRYKKDLKKYPNRLILGTETFCRDSNEFMQLAKHHPRIIGDFVWAGMDYLGESGIGSWVYKDYAPDFSNKSAWLTAGSGRLDILGRPNGEALYTSVIYEKIEGPIIAVKPVYQQGKHSPSAWKMTDAIPSWSWDECEGYKATVEVYAKGYEVELFINGKTKGRKKLLNQKAIYKTRYESGVIEAISFDKRGIEINRNQLVSAEKDTQLSIILEEKTIKKDGLLYVLFTYTDKNGIWKPMAKNNIAIDVENGKLLGLGHACPYNEQGYLNSTTNTYYGEAMAIFTITDDSSKNLIFKVTDNQFSQRIIVPVVSK